MDSVHCVFKQHKRHHATYPGSLIRPEGCQASPVCLDTDCRGPAAQERPPSCGAAPSGLYADCTAAHATVLARLHQPSPQGLQSCGHTPIVGLLPAAWTALACQRPKLLTQVGDC